MVQGSGLAGFCSCGSAGRWAGEVSAGLQVGWSDLVCVRYFTLRNSREDSVLEFRRHHRESGPVKLALEDSFP